MWRRRYRIWPDCLLFAENLALTVLFVPWLSYLCLDCLIYAFDCLIYALAVLFVGADRRGEVPGRGRGHVAEKAQEERVGEALTVLYMP